MTLGEKLRGIKKRYYLVIVIALGVGVGGMNHAHHDTAKTSSPQLHGYYVALGDSVAAGIGLPTYSDSSACNRTDESYPKLVATQLHYEFTSLACSGADTSRGLTGTQTVNDLVTPPQIITVTGGRKPDVITMTIGANDLKWTDLIAKCYTAVCGDAADTTATAVALSTASHNIDQALATIKNTYPTATPKVIVTGYYQLFGDMPAANCSELNGISPVERQWISTLQNSLNQQLEVATETYSFASFTNLDFGGHQLCSADPWIQGLAGKAPYHPTKKGQEAIAKTIADAIRKSGVSQ